MLDKLAHKVPFGLFLISGRGVDGFINSMGHGLIKRIDDNKIIAEKVSK